MKYWRLTTVRQTGSKNGRPQWLCQCDCGKTKIIGIKELRSGNTRSCGCLKSEKWHKMLHRHGHASANDLTYRTWRAMKQRCYDVNQAAYKYYGGRGIKVCNRWLNSFENFLADMGEKPPRMTIERINNDLDYMPSNCKWASMEEQSRNKRPNRRLHVATINGETKSLYEWEKLAGFKPRALWYRRRNGWNDNDLLRPLGWRGR